jgi:DNA-binding Lrp family transcriptional regulator
LKKGEWTFLTNHGRVLAYIAKNPERTTQEIAQEAGLTLRAVQKIITELEEGGYLSRHKEGRRNRYFVNTEIPMRHHLEQEHAVGDILVALGYRAPKEPTAKKKPEKKTDVV